MRARRALVGLLVVAAGGPSARAGVQDTPLPTFSDGHAAQLAALVPGMIKDNNVETVVICTNLAPAPLDVGLEVFDETGALRNSVATGDGAMRKVAPGATVTFGTGAVAVLHEDQTVTLNTAGRGTNNLRTGSGRVGASGAPLGCVALAVDRLHTIEDPAVCSTCQPPSLATVPTLIAASGTTTTTVASSTTTTTSPPCLPTPRAGCRRPTVSQAASVVIRDRTPDDLDQLGWKWGSGAATSKTDFGDPVSSTSYRLCVYDAPGGTPALELSAAAPAGGLCAGKPCWKESTAGFKYSNAPLTPDGLRRILLKAGGSGAAKISLKGRGVNLPLPTLPLSPPVTVQLQATNGQCWDAVYGTPLVNDASEFKARSD